MNFVKSENVIWSEKLEDFKKITINKFFNINMDMILENVEKQK